MHTIKAMSAMISNLVGVVGFRPVESLIVVGFEGGEAGCA